MTTARRRVQLVFVASALALLLVGCVDAPAPVVPPEPEYVSTWVEPEPTAIAPLRGTLIEAGAATNPSIAAKIDNHVGARPQVGLDRTDIVFEELVEGGLTRYVAIWQSDVPEEIGPVRSIRPMDPDIVSPFQGIIAYSGGQPRFVQLMKDSGVYNAIHGQRDTADTFYRTPSKRAPHNVLVKAQKVIAAHKDLAAPGQQFGYSDDLASSSAVREGKKIRRIDLVFGAASRPGWGWDETNAVFAREQAGAKDMAASGKRLTATNVVVLRVVISTGLGVPKTELVGSGEAWVASGGSLVHATWSKGSRTERIRLVDDTGAAVHLAPGNTWVELVPASGSAKFTDAE